MVTASTDVSLTRITNSIAWSISTMTSCTRPPPIGVAPPLAMLRRPADTAARRSPELRSRPSDSAMSRPSDDTTVASCTPGTRSTKFETSQLRLRASALSCIIARPPGAGLTIAVPSTGRREAGRPDRVVLGAPAPLAEGMARQQLVHPVRAQRVGIGDRRRRRRASGGGSGGGRGRASGAARRRTAPRRSARRDGLGAPIGSSAPSASRPPGVERRVVETAAARVGSAACSSAEPRGTGGSCGGGGHRRAATRAGRALADDVGSVGAGARRQRPGRPGPRARHSSTGGSSAAATRRGARRAGGLAVGADVGGEHRPARRRARPARSRMDAGSVTSATSPTRRAGAQLDVDAVAGRERRRPRAGRARERARGRRRAAGRGAGSPPRSCSGGMPMPWSEIARTKPVAVSARRTPRPRHRAARTTSRSRAARRGGARGRRRRARHRELVVDADEVDPREVGDLRRRGAHDVEERHRLLPLARAARRPTARAGSPRCGACGSPCGRA